MFELGHRLAHDIHFGNPADKLHTFLFEICRIWFRAALELVAPDADLLILPQLFLCWAEEGGGPGLGHGAARAEEGSGACKRDAHD